MSALASMGDPAIDAASQILRDSRGGTPPRVGIILGSGLGPLADRIQQSVRIAYRDLPGFPTPRVEGHAGQLVQGILGGVKVIALQGRSHLYEGWSWEQIAFPIRVLAALGIKLLIVSNASGGINPRFHSGQIVLLDSHINALGRRFAPLPVTDRCPPPSDIIGTLHRRCNVYNAEWMERAQACALALGFSLPRGTYLATLGPNYETRAEYRAFAKMGADLVGMSTVPEVLAASERGIPTLAFSIVTNVANPDRPKKTEHAEVLDWSQAAQQRLLPLVEALLQSMPPAS